MNRLGPHSPDTFPLTVRKSPRAGSQEKVRYEEAGKVSLPFTLTCPPSSGRQWVKRCCQWDVPRLRKAPPLMDVVAVERPKDAYKQNIGTSETQRNCTNISCRVKVYIFRCGLRPGHLIQLNIYGKSRCLSWTTYFQKKY